MKIDINKKYQTRDGREVRIYAVDGGGDYPVHGAVKSGGSYAVESWTEHGYINRSSAMKVPVDLIEIKSQAEQLIERLCIDKKPTLIKVDGVTFKVAYLVTNSGKVMGNLGHDDYICDIDDAFLATMEDAEKLINKEAK